LITNDNGCGLIFSFEIEERLVHMEIQAIGYHGAWSWKT
jgi:hypothetical protein